MSSRIRPLPHRSAWLEIDLDAIRHNVAIIRSLVGAAAVAPVVKADGYGHGLAPVVQALTGITDALCVATLDEAVAVRALWGSRVLLLYPVPAAAAADAVGADVELTLMSEADFGPLQRVAPAHGHPVAIHLCVETGLHRGGLRGDDVMRMAVAVRDDPRFRLAGLWSNLASPHDPDGSAAQVRRLVAAAEALVAAGVPMPERHAAASGGIFAEAAPAFDLVRPGLAVYGVLDAELPLAAGARTAAARLRPAMALKARPVAFSDVAVGDGVGYGGAWQAERPSRVAILPVGYADGYLRGAQPDASALVRGARVPLAGVISMDALAVDVTDLPGIDGSDEFVLLGRQGDLEIRASELARWRNTIPWEVLSGMAARLDRVYYPVTGASRQEP